MDLTSIIEIVVAIVVIYFFIKLIVNPVIKLIIGVVVFIVAIYLLQRFAGFNFNNILSSFGISWDTSKWSSNFNWISGPVNYYLNQAMSVFHSLWAQTPKSTKP